MALFHLSVTQTKRSAGQSAIASAAYRAGERLYSEYYGEYSDYTRKGGVICSDILLPSHAPPEYADRQTLWNAVEKAERGKNAQLAYSFDIALQNEFSLEENIALARQFLLENFVSRGMVVDFAVHQPDREDGGIPNPHFHVSRRYGADGTRLWNGKTPEEFTEADAYRFMAETEAVLQRKELMDDPAQPAPASGKEEFYLSKKDDVLLTPEQIAAEERRWLFDAPIAELAEVKGVSIDEAVKMRTDAVLQEAVVPITVSVRPIEPQGKLIGFASVNFGGVVIDDFKVVDGKNGIFLGAPSKPDPASRTGYRATVRIPDRATQERINAAGVEAYHAAVEQLVARAQAVRPAPIKEQMAEAAKQAGKENTARPAPAKAKEARNDR